MGKMPPMIMSPGCSNLGIPIFLFGFSKSVVLVTDKALMNKESKEQRNILGSRSPFYYGDRSTEDQARRTKGASGRACGNDLVGGY